MPESYTDKVNSLPEDIAAPRDNGELIFAEPWQARAFGMAVLLNENGAYPWQRFSDKLSESIARVESDPNGQRDQYYQRWLESLEALAIENGLITSDELQAKTELQAHEHHHAHDH